MIRVALTGGPVDYDAEVEVLVEHTRYYLSTGPLSWDVYDWHGRDQNGTPVLEYEGVEERDPKAERSPVPEGHIIRLSPR